MYHHPPGRCLYKIVFMKNKKMEKKIAFAGILVYYKKESNFNNFRPFLGRSLSEM